MKLALCLVAAAYLAFDLCLWHGPADRWVVAQLDASLGVVARVHGQPITAVQIDEATQQHLFRRGVDWTKLEATEWQKARAEVLPKLIDGALIRVARLAASIPSTKSVDEELSLFIKQFPLDTDYPARLPLQQLTEGQLRDQMQAARDDHAWIEQQIQPQLNAITEADAQAWYETHKTQFTVPEVFRAAHLFLSGHEPKNPDREPEIRELYRRLIAGEATFESLVAEVSEDERTKPLAGDLGWFSRERMPADFMAAVTALEPGKLSRPVQTKLGWHVIRLIKKKPARVPGFDEVKDEVLTTLRNDRRDQAVRALMAELRRSAGP